MRKLVCAKSWLASILWAGLLGAPVLAAEEVIWKIGEVDRSDHEFVGSATARTNQPVLVRVGTGSEARQWPKFHPGSGNGAFGGQPYRFTLAFDLPAQPPRGTFYLDLSLLFRQPRVPALELELNGHRGRYYFDPEPMFEIGNGDDQFNPIRSVQRRRLALPARYFQPGENRLTLIAVDEPAAVIHNRTVGGTGDSGFFYDALALSHNPDAALDDSLEVSLTPTVLFPRTRSGLKEECWLTVHFPGSWPGGKARVTLGRFVTEIEAPKPAEFGEGRYLLLVPADLPAGVARVDFRGGGPGHDGLLSPTLSSSPDCVGTGIGEGGGEGEWVQRCSAKFTPGKKWKVFYAPNEHLDIGYTDYRPKVAEVHARAVDDLLKVLAAHPNYRFNLDGSWIAEQWLATRSAGQAAQLAAQARAGRIGLNAFYSSFVTDYPSLETFIRNLYLSRELQARHGVPFDFANITDIPGNSWSVPSVLAAAGIRYFTDGGNQDRGPLIAHGHWNVRSPFWWEGPDGRRVLTWFSSHYHQFKAVFGLPPAIESGRSGLARFLKTYQQAGYAPDAILLYGTEVENLPLEFDDASFVERWNATFAYPQIITCRFSEFFQYIEKHFAAGLPVVRGEAGAYWGESFGIFAAPTARDRSNQMRAISAETLASLTSTLNPVLRFPQELDRDIWRNILLYCEHTYGSARTGGQPEHDEVIGQLKEKEDQTFQAEADIEKLLRHGMSQLAAQIQTTGRNLIVFNPLSWPRSGLVRCMVDAGTTLTNLVTGQPVAFEVLGEKDGAQAIRFWAQDVPPLGYQVYRLGRGSARKTGPAEPPPGNVVENQFYRIVLEPSRAAIKGLYDKELQRELVDSASPYLLNEYLFVSGGGSETGRGRGAEDTQLLHPYHWLPPAELTIHHAEEGALAGVEKTPWGRRIRMTASATHTPRIETEILLPDNVKRIELRNVIQVDLLYAKQASYFAFHWAMAGPTFRYDIANGYVNPAADLLEGGCSEWFSLQHLVNVEDGRASVNLAVVDAPLVCLGDVYRGRWPRWFTNTSATAFSYVLNNYWSPKWAGKKSWELVNRYAITSEPRFEPAAAARFGRETRCPLEIAELKSSDKLPASRGSLPPAQASFAALAPESLVITALKTAEDGQGLVVRVLETAGRESDGLLKLSFMAVTSAREADALETPGKPLKGDAGSVSFHIKPHQVLTMRLKVRQGG